MREKRAHILTVPFHEAVAAISILGTSGSTVGSGVVMLRASLNEFIHELRMSFPHRYYPHNLQRRIEPMHFDWD